MKTLTRSKPTNIGLTALLAVGLMFGLVHHAMAAGTTSNTTISNTASLSYSVSTVSQTAITATATFVVDEKVNLTVAGGVTTNVISSALAQATAFTVTNNSNSPLDFSLAVNQVAAGDQFDATNCAAYVESGATAGYQSAQDTATFIDELAADATKTVYAVCDIPGTAVNTNTALVGLTATAQGDFTGTNSAYAATATTLGAAITATAGADTSGAVDIVFADVQGSETALEIARDAKHSARNTYSVATAAITVTKTATLLCDPYNGVTNPKNIPGSMTRWTITVSNGAGGADATLTTISDALAATTTQDAHLSVPTNAATCVTAAGTAESASGKGFKVTTSAARNIGGVAAQTTGYFTSANDADGVELNAGTVTATFAAILPTDGGHTSAGLLKESESVSIIFNITVN